MFKNLGHFIVRSFAKLSQFYELKLSIAGILCITFALCAINVYFTNPKPLPYSPLSFEGSDRSSENQGTESHIITLFPKTPPSMVEYYVREDTIKSGTQISITLASLSVLSGLLAIIIFVKEKQH